MVYLKACPRCRGDLFTERALREHYITCLQCGHTLSMPEEARLQLCSRNLVPLTTPRYLPLC